MSAPVCPMCDAPADSDAILAAHLASEHGLVDDPGTTTSVLAVGHVPAWLEAATQVLAGSVAVAEHTEPAEPEVATATPAVEPPSLRVYDPSADDEKWRPIAIGVGGLVVLIFTVVALLLGA